MPIRGSSLALKNLSDPLSSALPTSVRVSGIGQSGFTNLGFFGIDVRPQKYSGSFYVKGSYNGKFTAKLQSITSGKILANTTITSKCAGDGWVQHEFVLMPETTASNTNNTFSLTFDASVSSTVDSRGAPS